jgi:putative pyruvate formate lyase activating enzyme
MSAWRSLLLKYRDILEENGTAQFLNCQYTPVSFNASTPLEELWRIHDTAITQMKVQNIVPSQSLLDLKIEISRRLFQCCCFCEHHCGVNRQKTSGKCGVQEPRIASEFLHFGEEPLLVPSYTIFFSGCSFQCVFCQNWDISQYQHGEYLSPQRLAEKISQRKQQGAKNVNWVGGDPTPDLLLILQVLKELRVNIPQVWNSNMYCSVETMNLLRGVIDVYLTDLKYGNDSCAQRLSKIERYTSVVQRNHLSAYQDGEVIVRHLVMPNHTSCCSYPVLEWIKQNIPNAMVNVMGQYRPEYHADEYEELDHAISPEEYHQIKEYAGYLGLFLI